MIQLNQIIIFCLRLINNVKCMYFDSKLWIFNIIFYEWFTRRISLYKI